MFSNNGKRTVGSAFTVYHYLAIIFFFIYSVTFSYLSIKKYQAFNSDFDMGNILQAFFSTLEGRFMETTCYGLDVNVCRWLGHTEIILLCILPLFALFKSAYTLLIIQSIAIACGGMAIFFLAKQRLRDGKAAFLASLCYWMFPYLGSINLIDFHADSFMIFPHILAWFFLQNKKPVYFWLAIITGILCKEYVCVFNFLLGIMILRTYRKEGILLILLAFFQYFILTPAIYYCLGSGMYTLATESHALTLPRDYGIEAIMEAVGIMASGISTNEVTIVATLLIIFNLTIFYYKKGLILILPILTVLLSINQLGFLSNHRHAMLIAPLFITLIEGVKRIKRKYRIKYLLFFVLCPSFIITFFYPESLIAKNIAEVFFHPEYRNNFHYKYTEHDKILDSLILFIPSTAAVASENNIRPKLSHHQWSFLHPNPIDITKAEYYIFDFFETLDRIPYQVRKKRCEKLISSNNFKIKMYYDGIIIFEKHPHNYLAIQYKLNKVGPLKNLNMKNGFSVITSNVEKNSNSHVLHTYFQIDSTFSSSHALISFFIKEKETPLRVLHLPSYFQKNNINREEGIYEEKFQFHVPQNITISDRRHEIRIYQKNEYMPFFERESFLLNTHPIKK